jgi:hypothetical protein
MSVGVAGFTFGGGAEYGGHIVVALYVGLGGEIQIAAVGLGFTGEGGLKVVFGLASFKF